MLEKSEGGKKAKGNKDLEEGWKLRWRVEGRLLDELSVVYVLGIEEDGVDGREGELKDDGERGKFSPQQGPLSRFSRAYLGEDTSTGVIPSAGKLCGGGKIATGTAEEGRAERSREGGKEEWAAKEGSSDISPSSASRVEIKMFSWVQ